MNDTDRTSIPMASPVMSDEELDELIESFQSDQGTSVAAESVERTQEEDSPVEMGDFGFPEESVESPGDSVENGQYGSEGAPPNSVDRGDGTRFWEPHYPPASEAENKARLLSIRLIEYGYECYDKTGDTNSLLPLIHNLEDAENLEMELAAQEPLLRVLKAGYGFVDPREYRIKENSPTWLMDDTTSRFSGAEWFSEIQKTKIILAGIGGIGSNAVFQLARMHPSAMFLYDGDIVESVNMSGQLFSKNDVGRYKVDAIAQMIRNYTSMENIYAVNQRFDLDSEAGDIMICGFDNMDARRLFFDAWENHVKTFPEEDRHKCLFIDGRLSLAMLQVIAVTGDDEYGRNRYRKEFLFADYEAEQTVCSMKQTTYLACMIGSFIVNLFTNFIANQLSPVIPYDLPFFIEYDAQNMLFRVER